MACFPWEISNYLEKFFLWEKKRGKQITDCVEACRNVHSWPSFLSKASESGGFISQVPTPVEPYLILREDSS